MGDAEDLGKVLVDLWLLCGGQSADLFISDVILRASRQTRSHALPTGFRVRGLVTNQYASTSQPVHRKRLYFSTSIRIHTGMSCVMSNYCWQIGVVFLFVFSLYWKKRFSLNCKLFVCKTKTKTNNDMLKLVSAFTDNFIWIINQLEF